MRSMNALRRPKQVIGITGTHIPRETSGERRLREFQESENGSIGLRRRTRSITPHCQPKINRLVPESTYSMAALPCRGSATT